MRSLQILVMLLLLAAPALAAPATVKPGERSSAQRRAFVKLHPCPAPANAAPDGTRCPGFRVDHIVPLACGGADRPANMQWLTTEAWRAKSKWERKGCR